MERFLPDAASVARQVGLDLRARGSRHWTCCPLHGEKTPSMCFFPDGKFHCFGCGAHGDAVDLYAALHNVSIGEALRACRGSRTHTPKPKAPTAADLHRKLLAWKNARWAATCQQLHQAQGVMNELEQQHTPAQLAQLDAFWEAVDRLATAKDTLNLLESADMAQLLKMSTEEKA